MGSHISASTTQCPHKNIAEISIRTFKAYFLVILAGVDPDFPKYMWDNMLAQTELTINPLSQETLNPRMSAWEYYNGIFDYSATPLGSLGCKIMIHKTSNTINHGNKEEEKDLV